MPDRKSQGRIFWGLLLIVLGVLFLLDRMGQVDFGDLFSRYWPVVFILIGISILLSHNFRNVGGGLFFIFFGAFFLLIRLRVFDRALWNYVWPLAIIGAGLWILFRPALARSKKKIPELTADVLDIHQVFSGTERAVDSQDFKGGSIEVIFGSAEVDMRAARLAGGQARLACSVVFGAIEIVVPHGWQIVLEGSPFLGSMEVKKPAVPESERTGTLTVNGSAVFGSLEIKE